MAQGASRDDFIRFLDYLGDKGLIAKATASARKTAAQKILSVLSDDEAEDVTTLNLELLMSRFENLNPHQYTPESLAAYQSRLKKGLEDFLAYLENPVAFRPRGASRAKRESKPAGRKANATPDIKAASPAASPVVEMPNASTLPIPLRQNLVVRVFGLPFDLTKGEAQKIANIILAHALPED